MNLVQVKQALFKSQCQNYIKDGMSLSEPIPSKGDDGLIDNYFVYYEDLESYIISGPTYVFGIDSKTGMLIYVKPASECNFHISSDQEVVVEKNFLNTRELYEKYYKTYEEMREIVFCQDCTQEQREMLKNYYTNFKMMFDGNIFELYKTLSPDFFIWIEQF